MLFESKNDKHPGNERPDLGDGDWSELHIGDVGISSENLLELPVSAVSAKLEDVKINPVDDTKSVNSSLAPPRQGILRRLASGTFNYGLGQSIPQLIKLLLLPVFTRLLSPVEYGAIDVANRFGGFITTLMRQGVPGAVQRFYYDHEERPALRDYVTTVAWYLLGSSLLIGGATLIISFWLIGWLVPGMTFPYAILAVASGVLMCNSELQSRLVQAREQSGYQARLNIGRATISLSLVVLFVIVFRTGGIGMLSAEVLSYAVLTFIAIYYLRNELCGRFQKSMLHSSLAYGWAMMPGDFVGNLTPLVTSVLLAKAEETTAANGIYFLALRVTQPLTMAAMAFQQAYNPIYFSVRKEGTEAALARLGATAQNVWVASVALALAAALFGPPLILLVTPTTYHAAAPLVPIFGVGFLAASAYNLLAPEVFFAKRTGLVPVIVYGAAAVEIAIAALTVKQFGAIGIAAAAALRMIMAALIAGIFSCRLVTIPYSWWSMTRALACGGLAYVACTWLRLVNNLDDRYWAQIFIGMGGLAVYVLILRILGDSSVRQAVALAKRRLAV